MPIARTPRPPGTCLRGPPHRGRLPGPRRVGVMRPHARPVRIRPLRQRLSGRREPTAENRSGTSGDHLRRPVSDASGSVCRQTHPARPTAASQGTCHDVNRKRQPVREIGTTSDRRFSVPRFPPAGQSSILLPNSWFILVHASSQIWMLRRAFGRGSTADSAPAEVREGDERGREDGAKGLREDHQIEAPVEVRVVVQAD